MTLRNRNGAGRARFRTLAVSGALVSGLLVSQAAPAAAQFNLFGQSEASPQDVYDTVAAHGFRLVGPLYRNGRVYVADVLDRRQRRERLIIAADSGRIVQRFFVEVGGPQGRLSSAAPAPGEDDRHRLPRPDSGDNFFSRLTRGWDDEPAPRPPLGLDGQDGDAVSPRAPLAPRPVRPKAEPRVVTRTEDAPITPSPLPPPPAAAKPAEKTTSAPVATAPAETPPVSTSGRPTTVTLDPLRIPGQRPAAESKPAPAAVAATKPADPSPPVAAKPAESKAKPPAADVPVAPLD